jgi:hypothetical protein
MKATLGIILIVLLLVLGSSPFRNYVTIKTANPAMIKLAQQAQMTTKGELVFLKSNPELVSTESTLKANCPDLHGVGWAGCYNFATNRMYLLNMPSNLRPELVQAAAYETLHPIYASIKSVALDKQITTNYALLSNSGITSQFATETNNEPIAGDSELFSLLGTEAYTALNKGLSSYYGPYFTNLQAVEDDGNYVTNTLTNYKAQMAALSSKIGQEQTVAQGWYNASNGDDSNYQTYVTDNALANNWITQYNNLRDEANNLGNEYNTQLGR